MRKIIDATLATLEAEGNLRRVPADAAGCGRVDLSSNDYLGLAERVDLRRDFFAEFDCTARDMVMSASASRLLAARQHEAEADITISRAVQSNSAKKSRRRSTRSANPR